MLDMKQWHTNEQPTTISQHDKVSNHRNRTASTWQQSPHPKANQHPVRTWMQGKRTRWREAISLYNTHYTTSRPLYIKPQSR